jgi:hypothetical protein
MVLPTTIASLKKRKYAAVDRQKEASSATSICQSRILLLNYWHWGLLTASLLGRERYSLAFPSAGAVLPRLSQLGACASHCALSPQFLDAMPSTTGYFDDRSSGFSSDIVILYSNNYSALLLSRFFVQTSPIYSMSRKY